MYRTRVSQLERQAWSKTSEIIGGGGAVPAPSTAATVNTSDTILNYITFKINLPITHYLTSIKESGSSGDLLR